LHFVPNLAAAIATLNVLLLTFQQTKEVILERRCQTLLELSQELPRALDSEIFWEHAIRVISRNAKDVPFALFYSTETNESNGDSTPETNDQYQCTLRGSIGLLENPPHSLEELDLQQDRGVIKYFKQAVLADKPIVIDLVEDPEAFQLAQSVQPHTSGDTCKLAVICPLHPPSSKNTVLGFMVLGLSQQPRIIYC
jgi:hypothetical protein